MKLTWIVFFGILAAGIHNVHAGDWETDCRRLWTHFLKLIETLQSTLQVQVEMRKDGYYANNPARAYAGMYSNGYYNQFKKDFNSLMNYTKQKIEYIIKNSLPATKNSYAAQARAAIEQVARDINNDNSLPDEYKYGRLPLRGYLLGLYRNVFGGISANFIAASPQENPFPQRNDTSAVTAGPQDEHYTVVTSNIRRSPPAGAEGSKSRTSNVRESSNPNANELNKKRRK